VADSSPTPGWYHDPRDDSILRLWDGQGWTDQTMRRADLDQPPSAEVPPEAGWRQKVTAKLAQDREIRRRQQRIVRAQATEHQVNTQRTLEGCLAIVQEAATCGAILEEEQARVQMLATARSLGGAAMEKYAMSLLDHAQSAGTVRIGSQMIGVVKAEGFFSQYARKEALTKVSTGTSITVFTDRIFQGSKFYVLDEFTSAQVYLDGEEQITQRPTLTRMALFSPLPGTALIPGLAFQKKKKNDMRHAEFHVGGHEWSISAPVDPDNLQEPRRIAQQINSAADAIARNIDRSLVNQQNAPAESADAISQLERLSNLRAQGALSDAEFEQMKAAILNQESSS